MATQRKNSGKAFPLKTTALAAVVFSRRAFFEFLRCAAIGVSVPSLRPVVETPFCGRGAYSMVAPEACTMPFHFS